LRGSQNQNLVRHAPDGDVKSRGALTHGAIPLGWPGERQFERWAMRSTIKSGRNDLWPRGALRFGQVQTLIGNLPPMQWLTRRRGAALLRSARQWLLDCGDGVRLQGFLSSSQGRGTPAWALERPDEPVRQRIAVVLHGWEGSVDSSYVI